LYEFEDSHPQYEPLLTTMLRTYGGIFDFPSFISENLLSRLLRKDEAEIKRLLKEITAFHIIQYTPLNDEPQIIFRKNRVPAEELTMDLTGYNKRKEAFIKRVNTMIAYTGINNCRSNFINRYFGDQEHKPCGICDNCLRPSPGSLSTQEFEKITSEIEKHLSDSSLPLKELLEKLYPVQKEKVKKAIQFLQLEQKITTDERGYLMLST
jgi:ATP-dependent DNA helicase RecQ